MFHADAVTRRGGVMPEKQSVFLGKPARFECYSTDRIVWSFNGGDLPISAKTAVENWINALRISSTITSHAGIYTCTSENGAVIISSSGRLDIHGDNNNRWYNNIRSVYVSLISLLRQKVCYKLLNNLS